MVEETIIDNLIDRAIIEALQFAAKREIISADALRAKGIKDIIKCEFKLKNANYDNIQKKIENLCKEGILIGSPPCESKLLSRISESTPSELNTSPEMSGSSLVKSKKRLRNRTYKLNRELKFVYTCGPVPLEIDSNQIPSDIRRNHTEELKKAINAWITYFPEPKIGDPFKESEAYKKSIVSCENHLLFPDLSKHLPSPNYEVCSKWETYKTNLEKLEKEKWALLCSVENEIKKCFCGLKLSFLPNSDCGIKDYYCTFINVSTYLIILCLSGKEEDESAWYSYQSALYDTKHNTKMVENDSILWAYKMEGEIVQVPKKERDLLIKGIDNYIAFLENIPNSEFISKGKNIVTTAKELQLERDAMIKELKDALFIYSFPGDCRYLTGS